MKSKLFSIFIALFVFLFGMTACSKSATQGTMVNAVASTTIVGDVVKQIGGDRIQLTVLFPVGADPHTFEPRPQDAAAIADADILFLNGLELEHSLEPVIESNASGKVVEVSDGVDVLAFTESHHDEDGEEGHDHAAGDPHTWTDPNMVMVWVENIKTELSAIDPENAAYYETNAENYLTQLTDLDAWIREEVANIPVENRKIVTDHESLGYFIQRYGFSLSGLVVDSLSTNASPSAQELSALEDSIKTQNVKAVFIGSTVNPALAEQVANDTGVQLVTIQVASLGEEGSDTDTYIQYMKTLVNAIVNGLQ